MLSSERSLGPGRSPKPGSRRGLPGSGRARRGRRAKRGTATGSPPGNGLPHQILEASRQLRTRSRRPFLPAGRPGSRSGGASLFSPGRPSLEFGQRWDRWRAIIQDGGESATAIASSATGLPRTLLLWSVPCFWRPLGEGQQALFVSRQPGVMFHPGLGVRLSFSTTMNAEPLME